MPNSADIASRMVAALAASEPDLDTSIGTPIRKILDTVAEAIAEGYVDQHLISYQYDIDSKSGGDLDEFCALFGLARIAAQRAQGICTFTRPNDEYTRTNAQIIPPGTQVVAFTSPNVYVTTTISAVLNPQQTSIDVPVQSVLGGALGNVPAGLLSTVVTSVAGITQVTNAQPLTGGADPESDEQLRARFKQSVFRSLAGTSAMYNGIARAVPVDPARPEEYAVSAVNVIGSTKRWREQIQVVSGTANSTVTNAAYIYADSVFCGGNIDGGDFRTLGIDFTFTPTNPTNGANATAVLAAKSGGSFPDGFYDLDFEYVPQASRNDPGNTRFAQGGINNRIDVWVNGKIEQVATQTLAFSNQYKFDAVANSAFNVNKYRTSNPAAPTPTAGAILIPLVYGPILSVPTTITVGSTVYNLGTDYWIVHRKDAFGYAPNSIFGLVWTTTAGRIPVNGTGFFLSYTYNDVAHAVSQATQQWRLVGTDAWIHCGKAIPIRFNLALVYDRRFDPTAVATGIQEALSNLCSSLGFDAQLQVSDVNDAVHDVPGVDNVRMLNSTDDAASYAMQAMSPYAANTVVTTYASGGRAMDVSFADDEYPILYDVRIVQKAPNSFRAAT